MLGHRLVQILMVSKFDTLYATNLSPDGTTLAVAAPNNDDSANNAGHVKTYSLIGKLSKSC